MYNAISAPRGLRKIQTRILNDMYAYVLRAIIFYIASNDYLSLSKFIFYHIITSERECRFTCEDPSQEYKTIGRLSSVSTLGERTNPYFCLLLYLGELTRARAEHLAPTLEGKGSRHCERLVRSPSRPTAPPAITKRAWNVCAHCGIAFRKSSILNSDVTMVRFAGQATAAGVKTPFMLKFLLIRTEMNSDSCLFDPA